MIRNINNKAIISIWCFKIQLLMLTFVWLYHCALKGTFDIWIIFTHCASKHYHILWFILVITRRVYFTHISKIRQFSDNPCKTPGAILPEGKIWNRWNVTFCKERNLYQDLYENLLFLYFTKIYRNIRKYWHLNFYNLSK